MSERFWGWIGKTALNAVTLGATGKIDSIRQAADEADRHYRASVSRIETLNTRMRELAGARGEANRNAHSSLGEAIAVLTALGNATGFSIRRDSGQECVAVKQMQRVVVEFNVALELVAGSGAGVATSAGAWAAVSALGVASTGTAIGGLSGAAATNAALAWFGGGSLAAGGGGIAAGTIVVGGIVLLPLIGISAWLAHKAADKKVAELQPKIEAFKAEAARLDRAADAIEAECRRVERVTQKTQELARELQDALKALRANADRLGTTGASLAEVMGAPGFDLSALQA